MSGQTRGAVKRHIFLGKARWTDALSDLHIAQRKPGATYVDDWRLRDQAGGGVSPSGSGNFNPRVKFNAGLSYDLARFGAGVIAHFIGPLTECAPFGGVVAGSQTSPGFCYLQARPDSSQPPGPGNEPYAPHHVSAQLTLDVQIGYKLS